VTSRGLFGAYDSAPAPPHPWLGSRRSILTAAIVVPVIAVHVMAARKTEFSIGALADGWHGMADFLGAALPPDLSWSRVLQPAIDASLVTLYIGLLGTTLSIPSALLLAVLAARNATPNTLVYQLARSLLSFLRAVPDVVFALVFVTAVGLGPFPGVLALIFHNTGVMGKLWAEAIEEIDPGPVDALRTGGARGAQLVGQAMIPAVLPQVVGLLLYRFDVNVRASLVLGLVGAGGIGFLINQSIQLFRFDEMMTYILVVLVMVILVDNVSALIRRRLA
jgi:phosphonate transport system permease protein